MNENINMETGEITFPETDIDMLITQLEILKAEESKIYDQRTSIELQLSHIARSIPTEEKTRRVSGKQRVVKVEFKSTEKWDQKKLSQIKEQIGSESFGLFFRDKWEPNKVELKKLKSTAGESEKLYFLINSAVTEIQNKPQITIEK